MDLPYLPRVLDHYTPTPPMFCPFLVEATAGPKTALLPILWAALFAPRICPVRSLVSCISMKSVSSWTAHASPD
eukprot:12542288-Heterocapsa_arctica.AAC.1